MSTRNVTIVILALALAGVLWLVFVRPASPEQDEIAHAAVDRTIEDVAAAAAAVFQETAGGDGSEQRASSRDKSLPEIGADEPVIMSFHNLPCGRFVPDDSEESTSLIDSIFGTVDTIKDAAVDLEKMILPDVTVEERANVGRQVHEVIIEETPALQDEDVVGHVRLLGSEIAAEAARMMGEEAFSGLDFTFTVLDSPVPNAFAHVGGYVYVNKGLLDLLEDDDQLRFVLAHEVGHVECGHTCTFLASQKFGGDLAGPLGAQLSSVSFAAISTVLSYNAAREYESDCFGYHTVQRLGVSGDSAARVFQLLEQSLGHSEEHSEAEPPPGPDGVVAAVIEDHFRTHPPADRRIRQIRSIEQQERGAAEPGG